MNSDLSALLVCPDCQSRLDLDASDVSGACVQAGHLTCDGCGERYPIIKGIPRFARAADDYCKNFGWQWDRFRRTQFDAWNGTQESERRFRDETEWGPADVKGRLLLDAGCGAGRFSAIASSWGARVVAVDLASGAAEACARTMRELGQEVDVIQASLYKLPFRPGTFDGIFSLGVIQHTPAPAKAIVLLSALLRPGGRIALWIYEKRWTRFLMVRNYLRGLTRRLPPKLTYLISYGMVSLFFPLTTVVSLTPGVRRALPLVPISSRHYWGRLSLREQWEWTLLDTYDSYAASYEYCQRARDVIGLLTSAGLEEVRRTRARGMAIVGRKPGEADDPEW